VVLVDLEFPSILYFYQEQQARGARSKLVRNADGIHIPPEEMLAAIDERHAACPISMVLFRSATILDARAIIERAAPRWRARRPRRVPWQPARCR